jgi:autotransporter-associated beta strand protein
MLEGRHQFSAAVWTGAAGDGQWLNPANWVGNQTPVAGQDVDLAYINGGVNTITIGSPISVGNLIMNGGYDVEGAQITVDGNITATPELPDTVSGAILGHNLTVDVSFNNSLTLIDPTDDGKGYGITEITDDHVGFLYISGASATYSGRTVVEAGILEVDCPATTEVQVDSGAWLAGAGSVAGVSLQEGAVLQSGINPAFPDRGFSITGPSGGITSSGSIILGAGAQLNAGYISSSFLPPNDRVTPADFQGVSISSGVIDVNGCTLYTGQAPNSLATGATVTLVSNSTGVPVSGTFVGLPQGSVEDGYRINYAGGANHQDVTLTVVRPITVASAAHASPNTVTGNTTTLSALGTTSTGSSGLTYHWGVVSSPAGAPKVKFSGNGTAAASHVVATFGKAGYYRLHCTISDGVGDSAATDVSVRVVQTATRLRLSPLHATVAKGKSITIHATELDQFGHPLTDQASPTFSVANGDNTINSTTGLFTATTFGSALIQVEDADLSATLGLQVTA